jgi:hypothetical protein
VAEEIIALLGHDCPLGRYPAPVVPIISMGRSLAAVFARERENQVVALEQDVEFVRHGRRLQESLSSYSPVDERLFGLSPDAVESYRISDESIFFESLLRSDRIAPADRFFRLTLAKATDSSDLLVSEFLSCYRSLLDSDPSLAQSWGQRQLQDLAADQRHLIQSFLLADPSWLPRAWPVVISPTGTVKSPRSFSRRKSRPRETPHEPSFIICGTRIPKRPYAAWDCRWPSRHSIRVAFQQLPSDVAPDVADRFAENVALVKGVAMRWLIGAARISFVFEENHFPNTDAHPLLPLPSPDRRYDVLISLAPVPNRPRSLFPDFDVSPIRSRVGAHCLRDEFGVPTTYLGSLQVTARGASENVRRNFAKLYEFRVLHQLGHVLGLTHDEDEFSFPDIEPSLIEDPAFSWSEVGRRMSWFSPGTAASVMSGLYVGGSPVDHSAYPTARDLERLATLYPPDDGGGELGGGRRPAGDESGLPSSSGGQ